MRTFTCAPCPGAPTSRVRAPGWPAWLERRSWLAFVVLIALGWLTLHAQRETAPAPSGGVPVGTILAFGGPATALPLAEGWRLCDGQPVAARDYPELFAAIGTAWGRGEGDGAFRLPDLRGLFLRGVDGSAAGEARDPDRATRAPSHPGGNAGNEVGSVQTDAFQQHSHALTGASAATGSGDLADAYILRFWAAKVPDETAPEYPNDRPVVATGGAETRPRNAYVHWMIKAR